MDTSRSSAGIFTNGVYLNNRRFLDYNSMLNTVNDENLLRSIIDTLVNNEVLERGFIFKCQKCRNADWYEISKVTHRFKCSRCYEDQIYNSETLKLQSSEFRVQPIWYYKLNEIVYQAYFHNSSVPLLTIAKLKETSSKHFEYISEIEIRQNPSDSKPNMEIDICCISDGNIIIGECKKGNKLSEKTGDERVAEEKAVIEKYIDIANKIGADRIVFSTLSENWNQTTLDLIYDYKGKNSDIEISIFLKGELLPTN
jgi:hypothetical protein